MTMTARLTDFDLAQLADDLVGGMSLRGLLTSFQTAQIQHTA